MTKIAPRICGMATAAVVTGGLAFGAMAAEDLQRFHIKLVGGAIGMYQTKAIEMPWAETVGKDSNGQVTAEILPHDMVGIPYLTVLRLLSVGALEFSRGVVSSMGGDNPRFEGLDHPGLTPTLADYRKAVDAYRPVLNALFEKEWKVKLLRISPNPPQVIWCNAVIKKVADLSGLKVRVYNKGLAAFVTGAGGTPITMPSQDVVPAAQRGVIDCAITGSSNGNVAKWPEVTTHLLPLNMGWGSQYWAASLSTWNRLDAKTQAFLEKKFGELDDALWEAAAGIGQEGINCSVGREPCTTPSLNKYNMTLVELGDADAALSKKILQETVLQQWANRCGADCVKEWNNTVGKALGVTAPKPSS